MIGKNWFVGRRFTNFIMVFLLLLSLSGCSSGLKGKASVYELSQKTETVELDTDSNGACDINKGCTNATTAAGARTNLSVYSKAEADAADDIGSDSQIINDLSLDPSTHILNVGIQGGNVAHVDLSELIGSDSQTITAFSLNPTTNVLTVTISGGNTATVDMSVLAGSGGGIADAPGNGSYYARRNLAWSPITASVLPFTPNGSISSTTIQAAIQEVRDEAGSGVSNVPAPTAANQSIHSASAGTWSLVNDTIVSPNVETLLGATDFANFRSLAGVQAYSANLNTFSNVTPSDNAVTLLGHDFATMRNDLGLVIGTNVLAPNGDGSQLQNLPPSGATSIGGLTDVNTTGWATGKVLKYNSSGILEPQDDLTAAGAGYVSTPWTYSNSTCTPGQYSLDASYRYDCYPANSITRTARTAWNNPSSTTYSLTFSAVGASTYTIGGVSRNAAGSPYTITGLSGSTAITALFGGTENRIDFSGANGADVTGTYPNYLINMTSNKTVIATGSTSSGGDPATGTLLVGNNSTPSESTGYVYTAPVQKLACGQFTASVSGTAHTCKYWQKTWDGSLSKCVVYGPTDSLLTSSQEKSVIDGLQSYTLTTPAVLTAGTTYSVCAYADNYIKLGLSGTGGGFPAFPADVTYPTPPSTFLYSGNLEFSSFSIWLEQ